MVEELKRTSYVIAILLLSVLLVVNSQIPNTQADIYSITSLDEGITVYNGTAIYMPEARVDINITRSIDPAVELSFFGNYTIETDVNQNVTLAFVYPKAWDTTPTHDSIIDYRISSLGEELDYEIINWEDLGLSEWDDNITLTGTWPLTANFAVFNIELSNESSTEIFVEHKAEYDYVGNEFHFYYIVGSARSFSGTTHEIVTMNVYEETSFLSIGFEPPVGLTTTSIGTRTTATWDFIVQDTSIDVVYLIGVASEYHGGWTGPSTPTDQANLDDQIIFVLTSLSAGALIGGVIVFVTRRRSPK